MAHRWPGACQAGEASRILAGIPVAESGGMKRAAPVVAWFLGSLAAACGSVEMPPAEVDARPDPEIDAARETDATPEIDAGPTVDAPPGTDACVPLTCAGVGAECGAIADGCGGTVDCPVCSTGEACGVLADRQCDAPPVVKMRNGFVQSDGAKSHSQSCDIATDGTIDCSLMNHPFSTFALPPSGITLPINVHISDRSVVIYRAGSVKKLVTGFLQSDGAREWVQACNAPASGPLACDPQTSPYQAVALPPLGLTLDAGTHVAGRYQFAYTANGVVRVRNGYVQSDGRRTYSQDCDVAATGALDCDISTHPFTAFNLPPASITPASGTTISDRYAFTFYANGSLKLRNGYVQSDGAQAWSQTCDVSMSGAFDCDVATHPFTAFPMPPTGVTPDGGTSLTHRYGFTYAE